MFAASPAHGDAPRRASDGAIVPYVHSCNGALSFVPAARRGGVVTVILAKDGERMGSRRSTPANNRAFRR